ncbi:MAG: helix-turn-helix domain-containing protein [Opitutaceae bacterium]|jgi:transposase-like protein|nr:helix-turn-helix domain-containing protein [Opitutaceae bacterium]
MLTQKIKELEELKTRAAQLEADIEAERATELAALPGQYGYGDINEFIKALKKAFNARGSRDKTSASGGKRPRARLTPELKEQVRAAILEGKSGSAIAAEFGISPPSVQNIKKEFGLVKPHESAPAPATEAPAAPVAEAAPAAEAPAPAAS